jgi:hypothetical protein
VRFEKWQALGNDYVIVERAALPLALTPARVRRLCERHTGLGADGILQLEAPDAPGFVARLQIFNPDGSEAELSGNGAREAILYLRNRGWTDSDQFSIQTAAGEIRPTITGPTTCRVDMGRARTRSDAYPDGDPDGGGVVAGFRFQHVHIATRSARSASTARTSSRRSCSRRSAPRSSMPRSSRSARTSRGGPSWHPTSSARASTSVAWGRRSPPGPGRRAPRWPTSCAAATPRSPCASTAAS